MNSTLLLGDLGDLGDFGDLGHPLVLRPCRAADRLLARMFGASLDRQLAAGRPPETSPLLAARAQDIVRLSRRRAVARDWEHLLEAARRTRRTRPPAVPVRSAQISAAEPAIRELARRLTAALPVSARGVAMASLLLTDATGPVYSPHSRVSLVAALTAAVEQLDPAIPLAAGDARPLA